MGSWAYTIHGEQRRPGDPDILLAHGLFIGSALWRPYVEPLARLGRVFVLDMPGHGRSEVPPPFDLPGHADAVAGAMTSMGIQRAICVGWSWGGALAMHLALRHPARVAALAVLDTTAEAASRYRRAKYRLLVEIVRVIGLTPWLAPDWEWLTRTVRPSLCASSETAGTVGSGFGRPSIQSGTICFRNSPSASSGNRTPGNTFPYSGPGPAA